MKKQILMSKLVILAVGIVLFNGGLANAGWITISISGVVTDVDDRGGLDNKIQVGDTFTGTYTYDSATLGETEGSWSWTKYSYYDAPAGMSLNIGEFNFKTDPADVEFEIYLNNNGSLGDTYFMQSLSNLSLSNGAPVRVMGWTLIDNTSTALSNEDLPLLAPDLTMWNGNLVEIRGIDRTSQDFYVACTITSATVVPEPLSCLLFALGTFLLRKPRKHLNPKN